MAGLQADTSMPDVVTMNGDMRNQDMVNAMDLSAFPNDMDAAPLKN